MQLSARSILFFVALLGVAASPAIAEGAGLANSPWPMFQHDPQHTGQSPYVGPSRLALQWRAPVEGMPGSPAIGADGAIYVSTGGLFFDKGPGSLYAINPDGSRRWRYQFTPPAGDDCRPIAGYTTPAIADDGTIYVHAQPGFTPAGADCLVGTDYLFAINSNGTLKWRLALTVGFETYDLSAPAVGPDGAIFVGSIGGSLFGIDSAGTAQWAEAGGANSSPAISSDGGTIYGIGGDLYAYQPDGTFRWTANLGDLAPNKTSPSVGSGGTIYACGSAIASDACHAINPDGDPIWSFPIPDPVISTTPAVSAGGTIYLASDVVDFGLFAVMPNGMQSWHNPEDLGHSPVIGADGRLYERRDQSLEDRLLGRLFVLNPSGSLSDDSQLVPNFPGGGELSPAIGSNGTLYAPMPNKLGSGYEPTDQHLGAYVQGSRLTVSVSGARGEVTGPGIDCTNGWGLEDCSETYIRDTPVTLQATGWGINDTFTGWSGACAGGGASCQVTMDSDKSVSATFVETFPSQGEDGQGEEPSAGPNSKAAAIKRCKKRFKGKKRQRCIKKAKARASSV